MYLTRLVLANFRNYAHLELDLDCGITVIQGQNACGKTSLLEAIFYVATSRSLHASNDRELIHWGARSEPIPFARVEAHVERSNGIRTHIEIVLMIADEKAKTPATPLVNGRLSKRIKVNGVTRRAMDLLGELNVVLFLPEDLEMIFGSPAQRRRYLDITLAQIDARYARALARYHQIVEQRNGLLREFRERAYQPTELAIWDRQLVEEGTYLLARRAETIARYNHLVAQTYAHLTEQHEQLALVYQPSVTFDLNVPRHTEIAQHFAQQLDAMRARELNAAMTLVGPHRDDVRFLVTRHHDGMAMDATTFASRGQGRTIALALKLAEVQLMRAETGEDPVLLLDDVMSELDGTRRAALAAAVQSTPQTLITTTDLTDFSTAFLENARVVRVCNGKVEIGD
jgi:DNA replication and repair protein RecF